MPGLLDNVTDAELDQRRERAGYSPTERGLYGVMATFVQPETGELLTETFAGCTTREGARAAAAACIALGPSWRIASLSHPLSILRDLDAHGSDTRDDRADAQLLGRFTYLLAREMLKAGRDAEHPTRAEQRRRAERE